MLNFILMELLFSSTKLCSFTESHRSFVALYISKAHKKAHSFSGQNSILWFSLQRCSGIRNCLSNSRITAALRGILLSEYLYPSYLNSALLSNVTHRWARFLCKVHLTFYMPNPTGTRMIYVRKKSAPLLLLMKLLCEKKVSQTTQIISM